MNAELSARRDDPSNEHRHAGARDRVGLLGPATSLGGVVWAILQPYRITLLHPRGQGFWWLFVEPPLLVIAVGVFFALVVAPGLLARPRGGDDAAAR